MRGLQQIITSVGIESMVGSREWFSQGLAHNDLQLYAFGQVGVENQGARLNWLLPLGFYENDPLPELLDNLAMEAGLRGAKYIIASVQVENCLFETLRRAGYCMCGWQSIWELPNNLNNSFSTQISWFKPNPTDELELTLLQHRLLSPATRSVTAGASQVLPDFALRIDGVLQGYARVNCVKNKIMIMPVLMNNLVNPESVLAALVESFFPSMNKKYLLQTADSGWLTDCLESIAVQLTPREEILVKHFAAVKKLPAAELNHSTSKHRVDTVTPMIPAAGRKDNI
jgi:hypothetical protein